MLQFDGASASNLAHRYLWSNGVDALLADEQVTSLGSGGNTLWALSDNQGSVRDIADLNEGTGVTSITNHRTYNSFGKLTSETNSAVDLVFGYTGKYLDDATSYQNNVNRWYDSNLGQWFNEDPKGFDAGDTNLRRYVYNNILKMTDPFGLAPPQNTSATPTETGGIPVFERPWTPISPAVVVAPLGYSIDTPSESHAPSLQPHYTDALPLNGDIHQHMSLGGNSTDTAITGGKGEAGEAEEGSTTTVETFHGGIGDFTRSSTDTPTKSGPIKFDLERYNFDASGDVESEAKLILPSYGGGNLSPMATFKVSGLEGYTLGMGINWHFGTLNQIGDFRAFLTHDSEYTALNGQVDIGIR